jgi:hypothetical protein
MFWIVLSKKSDSCLFIYLFYLISKLNVPLGVRLKCNVLPYVISLLFQEFLSCANRLPSLHWIFRFSASCRTWSFHLSRGRPILFFPCTLVS